MITLDDAQGISLLEELEAANISSASVDALRAQVDALGTLTYEMPIEFLSPPEIAGQTGVMIVSRITHAVTGLKLDNNGPAPEPCSYRAL